MRHLKDRIDGFFLGGIDKTTGVHDDDICLHGILSHLVFITEDPEHNLGIDSIFIAPKAH